jgi:hypothetical protein
MSEGLLFLKPLNLNRDGTCTDFDVNEGKRTVRRIYEDISAGGLWFWVPERPSTITRGGSWLCADTGQSDAVPQAPMA